MSRINHYKTYSTITQALDNGATIDRNTQLNYMKPALISLTDTLKPNAALDKSPDIAERLLCLTQVSRICI